MALAQSDSFEAAHAMQERALRMVHGRESTYRGFVAQVHARLAALQRRQDKFEHLRQSVAWLLEQRPDASTPTRSVRISESQ